MTSRSRPPRIPDNNSVNEEVRGLREELERVQKERDDQIIRLREALERVTKERDDQIIRFFEFREATHKLLVETDQMIAKSRETQELISEKLKRKLAGISCSEPEDNRIVEEAERDELILELQTRLAVAEATLIEGDDFLKKLHTEIMGSCDKEVPGSNSQQISES